MVQKSTAQGMLLVLISVCVTILGLELALRVRHGTLLQFESLTAPPARTIGRMQYDSRLGWTPRPGRFVSDWSSSVDALGLRDNGRSLSTTARPILAIGDSFTFGDEVEDGETWPAYLEGALNRRTLNAGVGAYGIDQAVLRAEMLLDEYNPDVVILPFISDDISRTEYEFYPYGRGWKPYFEVEDGVLRLLNTPVPATPPTFHRFQTLRRILGYSFFANMVVSRLHPQWWWDVPRTTRVHTDGESVSIALLTRLDSLTRERGGQFIAVSLATNGRIGGNDRLLSVVQGARANGVRVLDLAGETVALPPEQLRRSFRPGGHYSPEMNAWVADQIAGALR